MKILIIANARRKGGLSGSDSIYLNFAKHWDADIRIWDQLDTDFKPFFICYIYRIFMGVLRAIRCKERFDFVYSASDFLMDSLPGYVFKLRGMKWVASFYLLAPRQNLMYRLTQELAYRIIRKKADVVCITNASLKYLFRHKRTVSVHGGIDFHLAGLSARPKLYDAVFCGRIHPTKGIDELISIWRKVRRQMPEATLAVIGGGDLGMKHLEQQGADKIGIHCLGFMDEARYWIYKQSKVVLYPATYSHFSMSPVEAMACGCPMVAFNLPVMQTINPEGTLLAHITIMYGDRCFGLDEFATMVCSLIKSHDKDDAYYNNLSMRAYQWAKEWDWKKRAPQVFEKIKGYLL